MTEFEIIAQFFNKPIRSGSSLLGIGDDCALLQGSANKALALSTDNLVAGVHFFADVDPYLLGQKALMVNLSDLAAMGAKPLAFLLALTLPEADVAWLTAFSKGLWQVAHTYNLDLIGGNTTRGPLNINITIIGAVDAARTLRRDRAQVGDDIYVTGHLGGAALGLQLLTKKMNMDPEVKELALSRFYTPTARVAFAQELLGLAHAAIDISDGLGQDLQHILAASSVGADLLIDALPLAPGANLELAVNGGEDYELCFTAPAEQRTLLTKLAAQHSLMLTRIGVVTAGKKLNFLDAQLQPILLDVHGYQHL
jgi:thiamine-monophosphate kinase